jgi:uncharacterized protein
MATTFDFNPGRRKKVLLSVDGGGMRGTITIALLAELEAQLGQPIYELVDMVGGTSTGAVIAAGIGLRMSAQEILDTVYQDRLPNAFGPRDVIRIIQRLVHSRGRYIYDHRPFIELLGPLAQGRRVRDLTQPIVLFTTKDLKTGNTYYLVSRGPGAAMFGDWPVVGAVAASGAAPIYNPPVLNRLVDGGVGSHINPSLATATEALEYIGAEAGFVDDQVIHISLGTGYIPHQFEPDRVQNWLIPRWIQYVINESLEDATLAQTLVTRAIYGQRLDFRRYNPLLTAENVRQVLGITDLRGVDPLTLENDSTSPQEIALMEAIGRAYARLIDWRQSSVMPWNTPGGRPKPAVENVQWAGSPFDI